MGLDYVDLYLMHWPVPLNPNGNHDKFPTKPEGGRDLHEGWDYIKTYKEMEKLLKSGKVKVFFLRFFYEAGIRLISGGKGHWGFESLSPVPY